MFSVDQVVAEKLPRLAKRPFLNKSFTSILRYLLHEKEIQEFLQNSPQSKGEDFAEQVLDYFDFGYQVSDIDRQKIPVSGRVMIFANHPIGSLDGLALIKLVREIRPDVKVIANELLMNLTPLHSILLPVNNMGSNTPKKNFKNILEHLKNDGAVIVFPAGEVSRLSPQGVRDGKWNSGFIRMAKTVQAPLLPVYMDARNSSFFYAVSAVYKPLSTLLLVKEMTRQAHKRMNIKIGNMIPLSSLEQHNLPMPTLVKLLQKHLYNVGKNKRELLATETAIAHPENKVELKEAIRNCELLGETQDGKKIHLYRHEESSPIMREIGRLREIAFREVGEGTGKKRDVDPFDQNYLHLILWDEEALEIAGAYRFAEVKRIIDQKGVEGLYSQTLFKYDEGMNQYFEFGLELGRSFVQPKYWGKRSLDYLWLGIGAFIAKHPKYRFLFGPVSISNAMPKPAQKLLAYFYQTNFPSKGNLAQSRNPFEIDAEELPQLQSYFEGSDYKEDFAQLKYLMANIGASVPTLFKQYSEICEREGVSFISFNRDPDFNDCIDGLVLVDLDKLKPKKRARYIEAHLK